MEVEKKEPATKKQLKPRKEFSDSKHVDLETAKLLYSLKEKANKKDFGKRVTDSDILAVAVRLITPEHIKKIQDESLTERDRLNMAHADYMKANGKITLDQYLGKLLRKEI